MEERARTLVAVAGTFALVLTVQIGALALVAPFESSPAVQAQTPDDPTDPANSVIYVGFILVATAVMLAVIRLGREQVIRGAIVLTSGWITWFVLSVLAPPLRVSGVPVVPAVGALAVVGGLLVYPEWYVIDAAGVLMGAGAGALFGVSFGLLPAILLLGVLAVYDAISVYGTEHMLTLAEGVMDLNIPIMLVVPVSASFSLLDGSLVEDDGAGDDGEDADGGTGTAAESVATDEPRGIADAGAMDADASGNGADSDAAGNPDGEGETDRRAVEQGPLARDALFLGLGDAVMPTVMVASAAAFSTAPVMDVAGFAVKLPVLTGVVGTALGLGALLYLVLQGRPQAGLPLLNGGAILGYLVGAVAAGVPVVEALGLAPYL